MTQLFYAIGSKEPVLNGIGKDMRRVYTATYETGGVRKDVNIVASCLAEAYSVFEDITCKPAPELISITSMDFLPNSEQNDKPSVATDDASSNQS